MSPAHSASTKTPFESLWPVAVRDVRRWTPKDHWTNPMCQFAQESVAGPKRAARWTIEAFLTDIVTPVEYRVYNNEDGVSLDSIVLEVVVLPPAHRYWRSPKSHMQRRRLWSWGRWCSDELASQFSVRNLENLEYDLQNHYIKWYNAQPRVSPLWRLFLR